MEEYNNNLPEEERSAGEGGVAAPKMSFGKWVENVWYHYKWHILASIFIIVVIAVCVTQCVRNAASRPDIHIVYAGSKQMSAATDSKEGDAPFIRLENTLEGLIGDYDENGERVVELESYYWLSTEELDELEAANAALPKAEQIDVGAYASQVYKNKTDIDYMMLESEFYVWFISESLYNSILSTADGQGRFITLSDLAPTGTEFYVGKDGNTDTKAVYLKDLYISSFEGLDALPDDTLLVLRAPTLLDGSDRESYLRSREFIKKILNM